MKSKSFIAKWLGILLCAGMVVNLVWFDKPFSDVENRALKQVELPTLTSLESGKWGEETDTWFADQFVGRTTLFHLNYLARKIAGQRDINNVFLGKGALLGQSEQPVGTIWQDNLNAFVAFCAKANLNATMMVVPDAANVQTQKLPLSAPVNSEMDILNAIQNSGNDQVHMANAKDKLAESKADYIYYRTDHHWTSAGAAKGTQAFKEAWGGGLNEADFDKYQLSGNFKGTLAGKTGSILLKDDVDIYVSKNNPDYIVQWADGSKSTSIYQLAKLDQRNQYEVFLGPNQSVIHIETTADNDRHLLLLKDSYANSMIQFLLPDYQSITIVDPRYYYENISQLLNLYQINEAAAVFGFDTFVTDGSMKDVLEPYNQE